MVPTRLTPRWVKFTAVLYLAAFPISSAGAQDQDAISRRLDERAAKFDKVQIEFLWTACRAPLNSDPFEKSRWILDGNSSARFEGTLWLSRPHFRLRLRGGPDQSTDETHTWIDGVHMSKSTRAGEPWSVIVDRDRYRVTGPMPLLTPFELQLCDIQESLADLVRRKEVAVRESSTSGIRLEGKPTMDGKPTPFTVRAELDPARHYVMTHLELVFAAPQATFEWEVRPLRFLPVRGVNLIEEAVFALRPADGSAWQIYHYVVASARVDESLNAATLAIEVPQKNLRLLDRISGEVRFTDESGQVIRQAHKTQEEIQQDRATLAATFANAQESKQLLARRRSAMYLIAGFAIASVIVTGILAWYVRRRRALARLSR